MLLLFCSKWIIYPDTLRQSTYKIGFVLKLFDLLPLSVMIYACCLFYVKFFTYFPDTHNDDESQLPSCHVMQRLSDAMMTSMMKRLHGLIYI